MADRASAWVRVCRRTQWLIATVVLLAPLTGTQAETDVVDTTIIRIMAEADGSRGGCMALLADSPASSGLDCTAGRWVTFSCTGVHTSKADALRLYDAAQLAFATGRRVRVWVDDTRKHGGHCFASRIDVLNQ